MKTAMWGAILCFIGIHDWREGRRQRFIFNGKWQWVNTIGYRCWRCGTEKKGSSHVA